MRFEQAELAVFSAIVEQGGFQRASEYLHLSQSAVSQSLKNLETKLGSELVIRSRPIQLSQAGRRLIQYAQERLNGEQVFLEELDRIRQGNLPELSLAIDSTNNRFHAPNLLVEYCQRYQSQKQLVKLNIVELPSRNIIHAVLSGQAELGFGPFQTRMNAFEVVPLYQEKRLLVISPNHAQFEQIKDSSAAALKFEPLIVSSLDEADYRGGQQKLRDEFASAWEISSLNLRLNMIDRGLGIGYVSELVLAEYPQYAHLVHLNQLSFGTIERTVGLYFKAGRQLSSAALGFIEASQAYSWK